MIMPRHVPGMHRTGDLSR